MIVDDYRLARFVRSVESILALAAGGTAVVPANKDRIGIRFVGIPAAPGIKIRTNDATGTPIANTVSGSATSEFTILTHGDLVQKQMHVTNGSVALQTIGVVEMILPESWLHLIRR